MTFFKNRIFAALEQNTMFGMNLDLILLVMRSLSGDSGLRACDELKSLLTSIKLGDQMSKKENERAERAEENRVESARKSQFKTERAESDRKFQEVMSGSDRSKGCCEPCNYHVRTDSGEYKPCKMGHEDAGPNRETCADCSESHYHPKK